VNILLCLGNFDTNYSIFRKAEILRKMNFLKEKIWMKENAESFEIFYLSK
jgi:hypothetical protein